VIHLLFYNSVILRVYIESEERRRRRRQFFVFGKWREEHFIRFTVWCCMILQSPRRFYRVVSTVVYFRHMNTLHQTPAKCSGILLLLCVYYYGILRLQPGLHSHPSCRRPRTKFSVGPQIPSSRTVFFVVREAWRTRYECNYLGPGLHPRLHGMVRICNFCNSRISHEWYYFLKKWWKQHEQPCRSKWTWTNTMVQSKLHIECSADKRMTPIHISIIRFYGRSTNIRTISKRMKEDNGVSGRQTTWYGIDIVTMGRSCFKYSK
jgi:hypothetical protein